MRRWARLGVAFGAVVVVVAMVFAGMRLRTAAPLHGRFGDEAMLAFEFARTPADLETVLGADPPDARAMHVREAFDRANVLDFAFLVAYAGLIASTTLLACRRNGRPALRHAAWLGPIAASADIVENVALLRLTRPATDAATWLFVLRIGTSLKWGLLALAIAAFAAASLRRTWAIGLIVAASLVVVALAFADPPRFALWLAALIGVGWLCQLAYALRSRSL